MGCSAHRRAQLNIQARSEIQNAVERVPGRVQRGKSRCWTSLEIMKESRIQSAEGQNPTVECNIGHHPYLPRSEFLTRSCLSNTSAPIQCTADAMPGNWSRRPPGSKGTSQAPQRPASETTSKRSGPGAAGASVSALVLPRDLALLPLPHNLPEHR